MNSEIGIRINNVQSFAPDNGVSRGGNTTEAAPQIKMPTNSEELRTFLDAHGIVVASGKKWDQRARAALGAWVKDQGGKVISPDSDRPSKPKAEASLNGHTTNENHHHHEVVEFGQIHTRTDIRSTEGPFLYLPEKRVYYPEKVTRGLGTLYTEYNKAFKPLVEKNREWDTDYQYALSPDGTPINYFVQIDMRGLPDSTLQKIETMNDGQVVTELRKGMFEIENSLAMYGLLNDIFSKDGKPSYFKKRFGTSLDALRQKHGKRIALLAVTEEKYKAMRESEFGKKEGEVLTDEEVRAISGFDTILGPKEFREHVARNGGDSDFLLYARTSDPVDKLKNPTAQVDHPLLGNDTLRRIIKANSITFNIDNPAWPVGDPRRINDTKEYLKAMNMGVIIGSVDDVVSDGFKEHIRETNNAYHYKDGEIFSPEVVDYLISQGINPDLIRSGKVVLRAKPMQGTYGVYGHLRGWASNGEFRRNLTTNIGERGLYIIQPEMTIPTVHDVSSGEDFTRIDRNFMSFVNAEPQFIGGFQSYVPKNSEDARKGRNHGGDQTVWGEIQTALPLTA